MAMVNNVPRTGLFRPFPWDEIKWLTWQQQFWREEMYVLDLKITLVEKGVLATNDNWLRERRL